MFVAPLDHHAPGFSAVSRYQGLDLTIAEAPVLPNGAIRGITLAVVVSLFIWGTLGGLFVAVL